MPCKQEAPQKDTDPSLCGCSTTWSGLAAWSPLLAHMGSLSARPWTRYACFLDLHPCCQLDPVLTALHAVLSKIDT